MSDESRFLDETPLAEPAATGMKRSNQVAAIILFLFSIYMIFESLQMKLFDQYGPGPGLFPFGLGIILAILSVALFIEYASSRKKDKASPFPERAALISVGLVIVALIGYALVINTLGYVITTFIFVLFLMGVVQRDKIKMTTLTAIGVAVMLYLIFEVGLHVRLPKGPFGF